MTDAAPPPSIAAKLGYAAIAVWIAGASLFYFIRIGFNVYETHGGAIRRLLGQ
jgi:hypothetical protein